MLVLLRMIKAINVELKYLMLHLSLVSVLVSVLTSLHVGIRALTH